MNTSEMINLLGLRLEDPEKRKFTDVFKLKALNNSQIKLAQMLFNEYLTELQVIDNNEAVGSGKVALSALDNDVLRGAEGILKVKVYGGQYATQIDVTDKKKLENTYLEGTSKNPIYYVFENNIYIFPTGTTALNVYYLKMPTTLIYKIDISAHGTPATSTFLGDSGQSLSTTDDYYNDAVICCVGQGSYHIITDYDAIGATPGTNDRAFTVAPVADANFGDDEIYFVTHPWDDLDAKNSGAGIGGMQCDLNPSLHELVVTLAEAECWTMDAKLDRRMAALDAAYNEIKVLNERYTAAIGIGTSGDKRRLI